ncbi:MAG: NUDIX domain-containing protein [Defluviitaleaceae bacterium]|nr:NUDIX domain-containing protein [Defluviitaleaceae bacterium]
MRVVIAELGELKEYGYSVIFARYGANWLFCRHKDRDTYEVPGGRIEPGESPYECARRELQEETGAVKFTIHPAFDYAVYRDDGSSNGQVFYADVETLGELPPDSEMVEVQEFHTIPDKMTYPAIQPVLYKELYKWLGLDKAELEYWDILDKDRSHTGRKHRRGDKMQPGDYHLVVRAWIMNSKGQFLITRRAFNKIGWPGMWEIPSGSATAGEESLEATIRETEEECGIVLHPDTAELFSTYQQFGNAFHDNWLFRHDFDLSDVVLQEGETIDVRAATWSEISAMMECGEFVDKSMFPEFVLLESKKIMDLFGNRENKLEVQLVLPCFRRGLMNILVVGGTKLVGVHLVRQLLAAGHDVTIATRGRATDEFGDRVNRITIERTDSQSISWALGGKHYDVVYDSQAYSSNEVKYLLDAVSCKRYIEVSTVSVYYPNFGLNLPESDFDPATYPLKWCTRNDFEYDEIKRQAECAMFQAYSHVPSVAVRLPLVIGEDDYTKRLYFYVEHIVKSKPMHIDNPNAKLEFIFSCEAGKFLAWLADKDFCGSINAANCGSATLAEIIAYVEGTSSQKAIILNEGENAPLNGFPDYGLDLSRAKQIGYEFADLKPLLNSLLDSYIKLAKWVANDERI